MSEIMLDWAAGPLGLGAVQRLCWRLSWGVWQSAEQREAFERQRRQDRLRYHLGRGRLARDTGNFERGALEACKALDANPHSAWAHALLGQCLTRQRQPDLVGARRALDRARALEPTNGYFVRLLLDVLDAQGDGPGRADLLARAWWQGAPVERWLPDGPPRRRDRDEATLPEGVSEAAASALGGTGYAAAESRSGRSMVAGRQAARA